MMRRAAVVSALGLLAFAGLCGGQAGPAFDAAKAYGYVKAQVDFGPRVPGTAAHVACAEWLVKTLKQWTPDVVVQAFRAKAFDGTALEGRNIVASFGTGMKDRVLLCAHWDSRPFADYDPDPANHWKPVLGANDGASGVGVLLEVARQLSMKKPAVGVDIVLFDLEDYGEHRSRQGYALESWALGSQHWSRTPHRPGYTARFGILLDMVGAPDARFTMEATSMHFAPAVMRKVWETARALGYGSYFLEKESGALIDDHLYVNRLARIPTIDIIDYDDDRGGFTKRWHTVHDTMEGISAKTLEAVGRTVLAVVYSER
ncbi:MAG: M28 family peptidase [Candidatus Aminicenantes bacterium]